MQPKFQVEQYVVKLQVSPTFYTFMIHIFDYACEFYYVLTIDHTHNDVI